MAHKPRLSNLLVDAQAKALADLLAGGYCEMRSGEQSDDPEAIPDDETLLVRCQFATVAFGAPRNGELIANKAERAQAIRTEDVALAAGTIPYEILTGLNERIPREYIGAW